MLRDGKIWRLFKGVSDDPAARLSPHRGRPGDASFVSKTMLAGPYRLGDDPGDARLTRVSPFVTLFVTCRVTGYDIAWVTLGEISPGGQLYTRLGDPFVVTLGEIAGCFIWRNSETIVSHYGPVFAQWYTCVSYLFSPCSTVCFTPGCSLL